MKSLTLMAVAFVCAGPAMATNVVVNGDFSAGNTGFTSGLTLTTMTPHLFQNAVHGIYAVELIGNVAGSSAYGDWTNVTTDPFGANTNVFVADGPDHAPAPVAWSETVAVMPGTSYTFSFYGAEISNACCSNASLLPAINGTALAPLNLNGSWQQASFVWNSGAATSAVLSITDTNTSGGFNDFVMTDIALTSATAAVPEPQTLGLMLAGLVAIGGINRRRSSRMH